ncbi:MAG: hypothetical protein WKF73_16715 [Nocardioidaceae bacterium]
MRSALVWRSSGVHRSEPVVAQPQVLRDHRGVPGVGLRPGQHLALAPGLDRVRADRDHRVPGLEQQHRPAARSGVRSRPGHRRGSP